jgi:hypothetical protein
MPTIRRLEPGTDPTAHPNILPGRNYRGLVILFAVVLACGLAAFFGSGPALALVTGKKNMPAATVTLMSAAQLTPSRTPTGAAGLTLSAITPSPTIPNTPSPIASPAVYVTVVHDTVQVTREVAIQVTSIVKVVITEIHNIPITVVVTVTPSKTPKPTASPTPTFPVLTSEPTEPPSPTATFSPTPEPSTEPTQIPTQTTQAPTEIITDSPTQETGE